MIFSILSVIILALLFFMKKHITYAIGLIPLILITCISIYNDYFLKHEYWFIIPILTIIGWSFIKFNWKEYDFSKRIISLTPNLNKNKGRIIGRVLPYYRSQIKYNNSKIVQSELAMSGGTIMTGSSGSGKTYTMINLIKQDIMNGKSICLFNYKGDLETLDEIKEDLDDSIPVYELSWENCNFIYDPLINLDEGGKVEAILNMRKWSIDGSDEYYKTGAQLLLQKIIRDYKHEKGNYLIGLYNYMQTYNVQKDLYEAYNNVLKLIELTITSKVSSMFNNEGRRFSFKDRNEQFVLLVSFTSSTKSLATSLSSMMFKDLMEEGTKESYNPGLSLYIDEFGSCENSIIVKDILEKGRSCGICTMISMQDINQLIINTNAPFLDSVLGTVNNYIIFAGATRNTAEKLAGVQISEIENLLMSLKKPINGKKPTAIYISKYPVFKKKGTEVYRFEPYEFKKEKIEVKKMLNEQKDNDKKEELINNVIYEEKEEGFDYYKQAREQNNTVDNEYEEEIINFKIDPKSFL